MIRPTCLLLTLATTTSAFGQSLEVMQLAVSLGSVLASEEFCGLRYDQTAIRTYISEHVPASEMGFASTLEGMTSGAAYTLEDMSESQKTAHCAAIRQTAEHYGFTSK